MGLPGVNINLLFQHFMSNPLEGSIILIITGCFIYLIMPQIEKYSNWCVKMATTPEKDDASNNNSK